MRDAKELTEALAMLVPSGSQKTQLLTATVTVRAAPEVAPV